MFRSKLALTLFFSLIIENISLASSFDCELAKSNIEKLICTDYEISSLDDGLSEAYLDTKNKAQKPEFLKQNQLEWLKQRDKCEDKSCLKNEYKSRKEFLDKWLAYENNALKKENKTDNQINQLQEGSAMHSGNILEEKLSKNTSKLQKQLDELTKLFSNSSNENIDPAIIPTLKEQQNSWNKYISDECQLVGRLTEASDLWQQNYATKCKINLTEKRIIRINSAIKCIKKIPLAKTQTYKLNCLGQLATMTNGI